MTDDQGAQTEAERTLVVAERIDAADGVVALTLRDPSGRALQPWSAGAHVDLILPNGMTRQYSLCGDPARRDAWRIAVLRESAGRGGSAFVHEHVVKGTRVAARGPRNHFALEPAARYLFVAGGIGITPILPMVEAAEEADAGWRLLYGGRTQDSMAFAAQLARFGPKVALRPQDLHGLLDLAGFLGEPHTDADTLVYACGPEPMLQAVQGVMSESWPAGALHIERFAPVDAGEPVRAEGFEVVLARSDLVLRVSPGCSILETIERAGVPILSSCREGTCGTCETAVLDGVPDHRDSLLTAVERAVGDTMFVCVSRSLGPRLVLDL
jgi:ferredoxin-NADP reductase